MNSAVWERFCSLRGPVLTLPQRGRQPELCGWVGGLVGGWVVIKWPLQFSSFSSMLTNKMCWFQIWCQKLSTAFLSKVMSTLNFKIWKFKVDYPFGKRLKKIIDGKGVSAPRKLCEVSKKFQSKKFDFRFKNVKNS